MTSMGRDPGSTPTASTVSIRPLYATDQNTGIVGSLNVLGATRLTTLEAAESRFSNPNGTAATLVGDLVLNGDLQ